MQGTVALLTCVGWLHVRAGFRGTSGVRPLFSNPGPREEFSGAAGIRHPQLPVAAHYQRFTLLRWVPHPYRPHWRTIGWDRVCYFVSLHTDFNGHTVSDTTLPPPPVAYTSIPVLPGGG